MTAVSATGPRAQALHALSATDLLPLYRSGALSPVDVAQATLAHIARWEPHLRALYAFDPDAVLAQARASEARWRAGTAGALDGVPCTVKENIATHGTPVPLGCAATDLVPAAADAPLSILIAALPDVVSKMSRPEFP